MLASVVPLALVVYTFKQGKPPEPDELVVARIEVTDVE